MACKVLANHHLFVTEKEAQIILDFLYNLATITQMINNEKCNSICEGQHRGTSRQRLQSA